MCGRFAMRSAMEILAAEFAIEEELADPGIRYNRAPSQQIPIVVRGSAGNKLVTMHWGLIPSWAKDPGIGNRLINARSETAATKNSFRAAFRKRRCLVIADGFYEWRKGPGGKQPHFITPGDGKPFGIAGLWETWSDPDGSLILSATILTTEPNELMQPIHDRMPCVIRLADRETWLDPANQDADAVKPFLDPYEWDGWEVYRVSERVNSPDNEGADLIERQGGGLQQTTLIG